MDHKLNIRKIPIIVTKKEERTKEGENVFLFSETQWNNDCWIFLLSCFVLITS